MTHKIKIEDVGDFAAKRNFPRIRLKGKWLKKAGLIAGGYVLVTNPKPGVLVVQVIDKIPEKGVTKCVGDQYQLPLD